MAACQDASDSITSPNMDMYVAPATTRNCAEQPRPPPTVKVRYYNKELTDLMNATNRIKEQGIKGEHRIKRLTNLTSVISRIT